MNVFDKHLISILIPSGNWRAVFQRSAFRQSTAGNDVVATIFISQECLDQKTYLAKVA